MPNNIPDSKSCYISGGAKGIGRCLARRFLERGCKVFLTDVDEAELEYTVNVHLKQYSDQLFSAVCDLGSPDQIKHAAAEAARFLDGKIDVLVNMGGISTPFWKDGANMADGATLEQFQAYLAVNLMAPFAVSQACLPYMMVSESSREEISRRPLSERDGPCIIHVGSFRAHRSDANQEGYASSKAGLLGLTKSMAMTCEQWGIRVNLVAPGRVKVAHESRAGDEGNADWGGQLEDKDVEEHPVNRAGAPEDVVDGIEYLIGAGFITGQDLTIDGGVLHKKSKS